MNCIIHPRIATAKKVIIGEIVEIVCLECGHKWQGHGTEKSQGNYVRAAHNDSIYILKGTQNEPQKLS